MKAATFLPLALVVQLISLGCCSAEDCSTLPCRPPSECENVGQEYVCHCKRGIKGKKCDRLFVAAIDDACSSSPCWNDAKCHSNSDGSWRCDCPPGKTGKNCRTLIDTRCQKDTNPCENGAICRLALNEVSCICMYGWTGRYCETRVSRCSLPNPCYNGATCINETCHCLPNYGGHYCEKYIRTRSTSEARVIKIHNKGWYVARFRLAYETTERKVIVKESSIIFGQTQVFNITDPIAMEYNVEKSLSRSGSSVSMTEENVESTGMGGGMRLVGAAVAGLEIMDIRIRGTRQCFHVWGTSLFPAWSEMPCW